MASLQQAKFCDLGDFSHESTLKDDYKKKFGAIGFKASTAKNASFRYKKSVALKVNEAKKERPELSDEFTVGFPYK